MIGRFFAAVLAQVSEKVLRDLFKAIVKEWILYRKKRGLELAVSDFNEVLSSLDQGELSEDEKNLQLVIAGRTFNSRMSE